MPEIRSPWLAQLQERRPFLLQAEKRHDVAIVGGGIAGVATAAMLLEKHAGSVLLIDAGRIAHGASGRNAGQVLAEFERPFPELVQEFGLPLATAAQAEVDDGWDVLEHLHATHSLRTPLHRCTGYAGFTTAQQVREHLAAARLRAQGGLTREPLLVAVGTEADKAVTAEDEPYVSRLPHSTLLKLLQTEHAEYIAVAAFQKGCMNSALFCEELVGCLLGKYGDRFTVAEHLPVQTVTLQEHQAVLQTSAADIVAERVILCTNGLEMLTIRNEGGEPIDRSFRSLVQGLVGYMSGYLEEPGAPVRTISYYSRAHKDRLDPYIYLTRRPYEHGEAPHTLLCIGGPERLFPDGATYDPLAPFPADVEEELSQAFDALHTETAIKGKRTFLWHGIMGYTPSGIRCVGQDPRHTSLYYNLGCNGVGILPSVAGAKRIAKLLGGAKLPPSLFDPAMQMNGV